MADAKTSALPAVAAVVDAQEFPVNDGGTSKKATAAQIKTYVGAVAVGAAAGGDLSGTYPNPTVVDDSHSHTIATIPPIPAASILAANATNNTATMAATGLSVTVTSGHRYAFRAVLMLNDSSNLGLGGAKVDFDGGSATATNFRAWAWDNATAFATGTYYTTLAADIESSQAFTDIALVIEGSFEPATTGTFAPRFSQMAAGDGAVTVFRGSHLTVWES